MKFAVLCLAAIVSQACATDLVTIGAVTVGAAAVAGSVLLLAGSVVIGAELGRALFRGKRAAPEINGLLNEAFDGISHNHIAGCFERLLCDIAAQPKEFDDTKPIKDAVEVSESLTLNPEATVVSAKLAQAVKYGQTLKASGFGAETCETIYTNCPWTGRTLNEMISGYTKFSGKYEL